MAEKWKVVECDFMTFISFTVECVEDINDYSSVLGKQQATLLRGA